MSLRLHWVLIRIADTFRYWYLHAVEGTYRSSHPGLRSIPRPSHGVVDSRICGRRSGRRGLPSGMAGVCRQADCPTSEVAFRWSKRDTTVGQLERRRPE